MTYFFIPNYEKTQSWKFDDSVALRFQEEAERHIPDYNHVISLCLEYVKKNSSFKDIKIIDVGSALGHTIDVFKLNGFTNMYGVDNSESMIKLSKHRENIILDSKLPKGPWGVILCNWTLHFINEREEYLQNIYDNLEVGGLFILSDKMSHTSDAEELYYDFKKSNGITETEIYNKKEALSGILVTKPLNWYLETLKNIGFQDIQVINSRFMFNTIYAKKY